MKVESFYTIGHLTNDLEPSPHLGGGVSYSAIVAARLGFDAHIITKCPTDSPYITQLQQWGVTVHQLPNRDPRYFDKITSFSNIYDRQGDRHQIVTDQQEPITPDDLVNFPSIPNNSVILIAPVIGEISSNLFQILANNRLLAVTPQGYFRKIRGDQSVIQVPWINVAALSNAEITVLSEEDLKFDKEYYANQSTLDGIIHSSTVTVLTQGEGGATIFTQGGQRVIHTQTLQLRGEELRNFTGAGDSFAAVFIITYAETGNLKEAAIKANYYAAIKIATPELGVAHLPTLKDLEEFEHYNPDRVKQFLELNGLGGYQHLH